MKNLLRLSIFAGLVLVNSISNCVELTKTEQAKQALILAKDWLVSGFNSLRAKMPAISMPTRASLPIMPQMPSLPSMPTINVGDKLNGFKASAGNFIDSGKNALIAIEWQKYVQDLKSRLSQAEWQKIVPNLGTLFIMYAICKYKAFDLKAEAKSLLHRQGWLETRRMDGKKIYVFDIDAVKHGNAYTGQKANARDAALIATAGVALHVLTYMQQNGYLNQLLTWFKSNSNLFKFNQYSEMNCLANGILSEALA